MGEGMIQLAGVDGGGTRTRLALVRDDGTVAVEVESGCASFVELGLERAREVLGGLWRDAWHLAGEKPRPVASVFIGSGSILAEDDRQTNRTLALEIGMVSGETAADAGNDAENALAGALLGRPGLLLIAGTGSVCVGRNARGDRWRAGGWGHLLDDRGSAYALGHAALVAATRAADGRGQGSSLTDIVRRALGLRDLTGIYRRVHCGGLERAEIAALARAVVAEAGAADAVAAGILREGAAGLAEMVATVARRLGMDAPELALTGGLIEGAGAYRDMFLAEMRGWLPEARLIAGGLPPVRGAVLLAYERWRGSPAPAGFVERLRAGVAENANWRRTTQRLAPARHEPSAPGEYDLYPAHPIVTGRIEAGYDAFAAQLPATGVVACDGDAGVWWNEIQAGLDAALRRRGLDVVWMDVSGAWKTEAEIEALVAPFLGGADPLFGTRFTGRLEDFLDPSRQTALAASAGREGGGLTIIYGCGATLVRPDAFVVFIDLPKNELQFRSRAGTATNLGARSVVPPKAAYKRFYFVDWPVMKARKRELFARVDLMVDSQRPDEPMLMSGAAWRASMAALARNWFRVRPWFEPGPWGGQWCRRHIRALPEAPNYAWSFELITPENGLMLRDDDRLLEVAFEWLMAGHAAEVIGDGFGRFGDEFPVRFDFLDTVDGGELSIQVHPSPGYIRREFGERFTQDETYYILDAAPGATVNLGLQDGVTPDEFRAALERSFREATPLDAGRYVQVFPAKRHDLFLIPHGTVHGAGRNNLVLEISATPYIFTFKLYDWLRPDLDGRPRPLNIDRGMANLNFGRSGSRAADELVSRPRVWRAEAGVTVEELPTHPDHFYEIWRVRFAGEFRAETAGTFHAMNLVEGLRIGLETPGGGRQRFNYAETFVVPAAAGGYRLINEGPEPAVVVMARMKAPAGGRSRPTWGGT